jgi:hypothetical protein
MSDKSDVMRKLGLVSSKSPGTTGPGELVEEGESRCFGYLRGLHDRAITLEFLRNKEGDSLAFPYSWLGPSHYHPSRGILLVFAGGEQLGVRIRGRNLNALNDGISLYDRGILRHRVTFVRESTDHDSAEPSKGECLVERIEIVRIAPNEAMRFLGLTD